MIYIFLAMLTSVCTTGHSAFIKAASGKAVTVPTMKFNAMKIGTAFIFLVLYLSSNIKFHQGTAWFTLIYALSLFFSTLFGYMALKMGSMALSSLIASYSVLMPCLFGIIFLKEEMNMLKVSGLVFLLISMWLIIRQNGKVKINKSWIVYIGITFISNGICSVIQKLHQTVYPGQYCNEFMIYSFFVIFILFSIVSITEKKNKTKGLIKYALPSGILLGSGNYITLLLSSRMNATVLFPIITIVSAVLNVSVSRLFFKEKLSRLQMLGIGLGIISVLLIK